jgi:hypothetical protein
LIKIWIPLILCIFTFIIIRFRLRGIIFVLLYHYISILIVIMTTNFLSNVQKEFHHSFSNARWDPFEIPFFVIFVATPTLLYNLLLFFLLYYYIRQSLRKKRLQNELNVNH